MQILQVKLQDDESAHCKCIWQGMHSQAREKPGEGEGEGGEGNTAVYERICCRTAIGTADTLKSQNKHRALALRWPASACDQLTCSHAGLPAGESGLLQGKLLCNAARCGYTAADAALLMKY